MRPDLFNVRNALPPSNPYPIPWLSRGWGKDSKQISFEKLIGPHNAFPFADAPFGTGMFSHQESVGDVGEGVCSASRSLM